MLWTGTALIALALVSTTLIGQRRRANGDLFQLDVAFIAIAVVFMFGALMTAMGLFLPPVTLP